MNDVLTEQERKELDEMIRNDCEEMMQNEKASFERASQVVEKLYNAPVDEERKVLAPLSTAEIEEVFVQYFWKDSAFMALVEELEMRGSSLANMGSGDLNWLDGD